MMSATHPKPILVAELDYIEVDMPSTERSSCRACDDARVRLDKALASLAPVFDQLGIQPRVRHLKVRNAREAELLRVRASPSIRIGSLDLHPEHRDGDTGEVGEKRIWRWQGQEFESPPVAMLMQALLRLAADPSGLGRSGYVVPPYIRRHVAEALAA